ncbi:MAG: SOS response-associated peptidase [Pseudomonadota bacterium]
MPGRLFQRAPLVDVAAALGTQTDLTDPPRANIAPGQEVVVFDGTLRRMRWGIVPVGRVNARGRPVMEQIINARSETVFEKSAYEGTRRAVIPVQGWYEWTGEARRKTPWAIRDKTRPFLFFAAITDVWVAPGGREVPQVAAVTCSPSGDVRDIHHRMGVLLEAQDVPVWLTGDEEAAKALMVPWPDGRLEVSAATSVDWDGP